MQEQSEKWTQRGDGVFTDDEEDANHQKDSTDREESWPAGSFGQRLSRANRQASKTSVVTTEHGGSEEKGKSGDEELSAATDFGRKACSENSFVSDSRSNVYRQSSSGGSNNSTTAAGSSRASGRFRKAFDAVGGPTVPLQDRNAAFPPPPPGFHRGDSRGSSVRSPAKFRAIQRVNGVYSHKPHFGLSGHMATAPRHTSRLPGLHKVRSPPKPSIPGFPISRKGPKSHLPSVKKLSMRSSVSDVVEISIDNATEVKCSFSELARVLNGYYVSDKFELKGIRFETPLADAFSQVDKTFWTDCELIVDNCDFRALSGDACAIFLAQFTSKNIHLVGGVELPEQCQDLLELPTFKAAYCLKFSLDESDAVPALKIDTEKLIQWLHSGGEVPRYVMLQHKQISDLHDALATFRKNNEQSKAQSHYLVDIYTANCPLEYRTRTIQELEHESRQRLVIRYDNYQSRMILKRYDADGIGAKSFEEKIRTFAGVPVNCYRGRGRDVAPQKKHKVRQHVDAIERLPLKDVAVVNEQASNGHGAASIVPLAERALSVAWSTQDAGHKEEFMRCISHYIGRIFDMLHARGQGQETMQFKQRLGELFVEMERSVSSE